jgi:ATP-dependent Clp protease adaptor protein ClpS
MPRHASQTHSEPAVQDETDVQRPRRYKVVMHNDDYTTMDFVVDVLTSVFRRSRAESMRIMLSIHHQGQGIAGVYPKQIAEQKLRTTHDKAREHGFPLRCTLEKE